jgi:hypothetical protein
MLSLREDSDSSWAPQQFQALFDATRTFMAYVLSGGTNGVPRVKGRWTKVQRSKITQPPFIS